MTKINVPGFPDFWAQAHFNALLDPKQRRQEKYLTSVRARDFERVINNIIRPLLREINTVNSISQEIEYGRFAEKLHDVALRNDPERYADYPPDDGKQLVLDRLDGIEANLRRLNSRLRYVEIDADGENIFLDFRPKSGRPNPRYEQEAA